MFQRFELYCQRFLTTVLFDYSFSCCFDLMAWGHIIMCSCSVISVYILFMWNNYFSCTIKYEFPVDWNKQNPIKSSFVLEHVIIDVRYIGHILLL